MKKTKCILPVFAIIAAVSAQVFCAPIDLQIGCRPLALGGAFIALSDDANSVAWNPAGLVQVKTPEIALMHGSFGELSFVNLGYIGYVQPMDKGTLGLGWQTVGSSLKQGLEETSNSMSENTYLLAYGLPASNKVSFGLNMKRLTIDSSIGGGAGFGFDFGGLWMARENITVGLLLRNIAADYKNESFPMTYRFGAAFRLAQDKLRIACDAESKNDINEAQGGTIKTHFGAEFMIKKQLALRFGSDAGNMAMGIGFRIKQFNLDYSQSTNDITGNLSRISTSFYFPGRPSIEQQVEDAIDRGDYKKAEELNKQLGKQKK
ncbi:MAG: hypothetical protein A2297_05840 [Elusimicrobia bacterium RIFOXYB2_FULL_48_7]|nr:MAG: hypothetical protein A2297_05840 [Elusimicrobia bacterium RIFOXYB2_FULL_48_7]